MSANIIDARKDNSVLYGELKAGEYFIFELDDEVVPCEAKLTVERG